MKVNMVNGSGGSTRRGKSFRKLRWKNYLNHLLNLLLYCGNVSVDGRSYGENGSAAVNLCNKTDTTPDASSFAIPAKNTSFQPSSPAYTNNSNGAHKSFRRTSEFFNFTRSGSRFNSHDDNATAYSDSNFFSSNKSSVTERLFHLIKSGPETKRDFLVKSINHETSQDHSLLERTYKGPPRFIAPEKIVNTTRITNDTGLSRVKKSEKILIEGDNGDNKLSAHNNQSSYPSLQSVKNLANKNETVRKKSKSVKKIHNNSTTSKRGMKKLPKVSLLGLFELTTHLGTRWEGKSELAAAELAVKHINERGLLPGYSLELITNDTQVTKDRKGGRD